MEQLSSLSKETEFTGQTARQKHIEITDGLSQSNLHNHADFDHHQVFLTDRNAAGHLLILWA